MRSDSLRDWLLPMSTSLLVRSSATAMRPVSFDDTSFAMALKEASSVFTLAYDIE